MGGKSVDYPDAPKNSKIVRYFFLIVKENVYPVNDGGLTILFEI